MIDIIKLFNDENPYQYIKNELDKLKELDKKFKLDGSLISDNYASDLFMILGFLYKENKLDIYQIVKLLTSYNFKSIVEVSKYPILISIFNSNDKNYVDRFNDIFYFSAAIKEDKSNPNYICYNTIDQAYSLIMSDIMYSGDYSISIYSFNFFNTILAYHASRKYSDTLKQFGNFKNNIGNSKNLNNLLDHITSYHVNDKFDTPYMDHAKRVFDGYSETDKSIILKYIKETEEDKDGNPFSLKYFKRVLL